MAPWVIQEGRRMEPEPVNRNRLGSEPIATETGTESGQNRIDPKPFRNRNRPGPNNNDDDNNNNNNNNNNSSN